MTNKDYQPYIYCRATKSRIPVSQEEFDAFYKETSVFRRRQQRHGYCACPRTKWHSCDTDCDNCPYRITDKYLSLDDAVMDDDGEETTWANKMEDPAPLIDEIMADTLEMQKMLDRIRILMPEAIRIGELRMEGYTDTHISKEIGIPRTTLLSRLKKLREALSEDYADFF